MLCCVVWCIEQQKNHHQPGGMRSFSLLSSVQWSSAVAEISSTSPIHLQIYVTIYVRPAEFSRSVQLIRLSMW